MITCISFDSYQYSYWYALYEANWEWTVMEIKNVSASVDFFLQWSSCAHSAVVGCLGHKPQNTDRLFGRHWWNPWPCSSSTLVHVLPRGFTASHCHHSVRCLNKALAGRGNNYSMERMKNIPWNKWYSLFESNWCYITLLECIYMYHNLSFMTRKLATFPLSRQKIMFDLLRHY